MTSGRFFITPAAVEQWRELISPGSSYEEALADIIDWSEDAKRAGVANNGHERYRARNPLRCYFVVAPPERGRTLPAIVAIGKPNANWLPPSAPKPGPGRGGPREGAGRKPKGEAWETYSLRLAPNLWAEVNARGRDWLRAVIEAAIKDDSRATPAEDGEKS